MTDGTGETGGGGDATTNGEPLPAVVDSLDSVPEAYRGMYKPFEAKPQNGQPARTRYRPNIQDTDGWGLQHFEGLRNALSENRTRADSLSGQVNEYRQHLGEDRTAQQIAADLAELKKLREGGGADVQGQIDSAVEEWKTKVRDLTASNEKSLLEKDRTIEALTSQAQLSEACVKHKANPKIILALAQGRLRIKHVEGSHIPDVEVLDANGNVRTTLDPEGTGKMGVDEFVDRVLRDEVPEAFQGHGGRGAGITAGGGVTSDGSSVQPHQWSQRESNALPPEKRLAYMQQKQKAAEEAGLTSPEQVP